MRNARVCGDGSKRKSYTIRIARNPVTLHSEQNVRLMTMAEVKSMIGDTFIVTGIIAGFRVNDMFGSAATFVHYAIGGMAPMTKRKLYFDNIDMKNAVAC